MTDWPDLDRELDAWRQNGKSATFWWRDDDATHPTGPLSRLLDLAGGNDAPLALAVIPHTAKPGLHDLLKNRPGISVLQHGFAHINHAPEGEKKTELGAHRGPDQVVGELTRGLNALREYDALHAVLVPPWNRIDDSILPLLPAIGYKGISTFGRPRAVGALPGLACINAHADIIDWHGSRGFVGTGPALGQVIGHLAARRTAKVDSDEPTGLLTHHLLHDDGCWRFIEDFLDRVGIHEGARLINISEALTQ